MQLIQVIVKMKKHTKTGTQKGKQKRCNKNKRDKQLKMEQRNRYEFKKITNNQQLQNSIPFMLIDTRRPIGL